MVGYVIMQGVYVSHWYIFGCATISMMIVCERWK